MKKLLGGIRGTLSLTPVGRAVRLAMDAEFKEGDHPRAGNGQFGSGSGSSLKGSIGGGSNHAASEIPHNEERDINRAVPKELANASHEEKVQHVLKKAVEASHASGQSAGELAANLRAGGYKREHVSKASEMHRALGPKKKSMG